MKILHACDHLVEGEVRLLPTGGDGNAILCRTHYHAELQFRKEQATAGVPADLPPWDTLKVHVTS